MKLTILNSSAFVILFSLVSSNVWSQQNSTDCSTAKEDIAHLQHEKKSTDERTVKGVMSIMPIGLVVNVATSATKHPDANKEMEIKEYNQKIAERINEIQQNCNVQASGSSTSNSILDQSSH